MPSGRLNPKFYFIKAKKLNLPFYFPIGWVRIKDGLMAPTGVLVKSETQTTLSEKWTQVAGSIFNDDNCYVTSSWFGFVFAYLSGYFANFLFTVFVLIYW